VLAAASVSGGGQAAKRVPTTEIVVTLAAPALSAFGPGMADGHRAYASRLDAAQAQAERNVRAAVPGAQIRWRYRLVMNGFAVVVPTSQLGRLARVPGIELVWPTTTYRGQLNKTPSVIGADKVWGPTLANAGNGVKIGIIDDGIDASHPFLAGDGMSYPPGFPKGKSQYATPKVIVQRTFAPASPKYPFAATPFDREESSHATHVAGIAAGDHNTTATGGFLVSGVAPMAYLGNYKALTIPTPNFGLDGNAPEIAAAIEAAVADGMDVINLSLGEPEIAPSRDIVVAAIEGAARAGVVPVVAAGNDYGEYGFGSVSSPANAPSAITVAAVNDSDVIADFSSAGPTPVSLQLKPDVAAPGVGVLSSVPANQGTTWASWLGTSMASPHVAGGAALLKQQHPGWTVEQVKSALVQTADLAKAPDGGEVSVLRQGGGVINLPRALNPLLFASPTGITFPVNGGSRTVGLTDAGGGPGDWAVSVRLQDAPPGIDVQAPATVGVPGQLTITASVADSARSRHATGFVVLTRGDDVRRIPFLLLVNRPVLAALERRPLARPGVHTGTTKGGSRKIVRYRYPTRSDSTYPGPETVYRVRISRRVANFGVVVLSGSAVPHVVHAGDENHLTGYVGLPINLNPYFESYGERRSIAGAILPAAGAYDIVFDTPKVARAGPFTFRYWVNDSSPPRLRLVRGRPGTITVSITDAGAGVDPRSITAAVDGRRVRTLFANGRIIVRAAPGRHKITVQASDYQEAKNMEDVHGIKPNTATLSRTAIVGAPDGALGGKS
jgi:subtilisin family serine protease